MTRYLSLLAIAAALLTAGAAQAQYPDKPVRIIVPFIAGSAHDVAARQVAQRLTASFGSVSVPGSHSNVTSSARSHGVAALRRETRPPSCCVDRNDGVPPPK